MTHTFQHEAMATFFEIVIAGQNRDYARYAAEAAFRELDRLEALLSRFVESSDISRANHLTQGASTTISDETLDCLLTAADISLATGVLALGVATGLFFALRSPCHDGVPCRGPLKAPAKTAWVTVGALPIGRGGVAGAFGTF